MENSFATCDSGLTTTDVQRYIEDQIYTLPGVDAPKDVFTVLLTGSRATGTHTPSSDVDIDVLCPQAVYEAVHRAALAAGIITAPKSFFAIRPETDWQQYFGPEKGRPHFSVTSLDHVQAHVANYNDVWLWVWTWAKVINDPTDQFRKILAGFHGYPPDVLTRKLKYHWLLAAYWSIEVFPLSSKQDDCLMPAALGLLNTVSEYLKICFLAERQPYPYTEKLMRLAQTTELGPTIIPILQQAVDLVLGRAAPDQPLWERLERAFAMLNCSDDPDGRRLEDAGAAALRTAGVDPDWVQADYDNIDELLLGELGPTPD